MVNWRQTSAYDLKGNLNLFKEDSNGNGSIDIHKNNFYDDDSNLVLFEEYTKGDGVVDHRHNTSHTPIKPWVALSY